MGDILSLAKKLERAMRNRMGFNVALDELDAALAFDPRTQFDLETGLIDLTPRGSRTKMGTQSLDNFCRSPLRLAICCPTGLGQQGGRVATSHADMRWPTAAIHPVRRRRRLEVLAHASSCRRCAAWRARTTLRFCKGHRLDLDTEPLVRAWHWAI